MRARLHRQETVDIPDDQQIYVPVRVITKDNVDQFAQDVEEKLKKLKGIILY